jgi:hypothetical protein
LLDLGAALVEQALDEICLDTAHASKEGAQTRGGTRIGERGGAQQHQRCNGGKS